MKEQLIKPRNTLYSWIGRFDVLTMLILPILTYRFNTIPLKSKQAYTDLKFYVKMQNDLKHPEIFCKRRKVEGICYIISTVEQSSKIDLYIWPIGVW